jgi:cell division initiation protein
VRITPIDIRKQEFRRTMRGYDIDEVDTFMTMVSEEMEELISSSQQAKTEAASLKERLTEYQQMEATMRETLVTVQQAAEEKREAAHKEADIILKEAEVRAGNWIEDAHRSIMEIKKEIVQLRGMRDSYITRLRMLVQAQLDMLKLAEAEEETPDATLEEFEQRLEELTTAARERVAKTGETDLAVEEQEGEGRSEPEPAGEEESIETEEALEVAWKSWPAHTAGEEREPDEPVDLKGEPDPGSEDDLALKD